MPDPFAPPDDEPYDQNDKRMHALAGAATRVGSESLLPESMQPMARLFAPAAVGVLKEAADTMDRGNHTPDWKDAAATALGGALTYRDPRHGLTIVPTLSDDMVALDVLLRW